jgi:penicillin-binding protein 1C
VGLEPLLTRLRAAGFTSLGREADYYGLGLTLGNGEVTLLELAQGYAMLARGGLTCRAKAFENGPPDEPRRIFSQEVCFLITEILSDESLRIRAFGAATPLILGFPMAVKTGTSANWRDNWVVGYTRRYTVAVWAGDFSGSAMNHMSGAIGAGPLFHRIARLVVYRGAVPKVPARLEPPEAVEQIVVCPLSGKTPTELCPRRTYAYVLKENRLRPPCPMHRLLRIDRRNGLLASNRCPSTQVEEKMFEVLPAVYADWQIEHGCQCPPTRYSPHCPETGITPNAMIITKPRNGEVYLVEPGYDADTQTIQLSGEVDPALPEITWLVDGRKVATVEWPYDASLPLTKGRHLLEIAGGGRRSEAVEIEVR